jgi:hypothetical protein
MMIGPMRPACDSPAWPWHHDLDAATRDALTDELRREVSEGHLLSAHPQATVVGRCLGCDEVLVSLGDQGFALVHVTWATHVERPPWPHTELTGGFLATEAALNEHAERHR